MLQTALKIFVCSFKNNPPDPPMACPPLQRQPLDESNTCENYSEEVVEIDYPARR